ncbi:hypothetical protein BBK82_26580 [Lentzea guizhouensis]|uniref:Uncharacterized protein n=1 Tax=Lentzea guizhouensis TaxID=1586287 RepID=A0A1B2HN25_9PSEU|nr:hypothetical protein [Lentzea guizhouensis]ANZ39110.1 hypothetical protein BBK82_26580 [Lentzea guizhouensis]
MTVTEAPVWRPLYDEPLFTCTLLQGPDAVPATERVKITAYLEQVARVRGIPLHTSTAFNALHFGFDVENDGYCAAVLDPELFVPLEARNGQLPLLPVGTFVRIERGAHLLWGEVVARFGAEETDLDGWLPAHLSGARDVFDEQGCRRERVVVDLHAFGGSLNSGDRRELQRLRRRGVFDERGHLTGNVYYPNARQGALDDTALYAAHLLGAAKPLVAHGPLGNLLTESDDDTLAVALRTALNTIDALLTDAPDVRRWAGYATSSDRYRERYDHRGLLGGKDLDELVHAVTRRTAVPRFTGIWPLLAGRVDAARRVDPDDFAADPLEFTGAAEAVVHANLAVADLVGPTGTGRLPNGSHVRVDDTWQAGGVWLSRAAPVHTNLGDVDPLRPLGLGRHGLLPGQPPDVTPTVDEPELEAPVDDTCAAEVDHLSNSLTVYTVALRSTHIDSDTLPLPERLESIPAEGNLVVELHHDGDDLAEDERVHRVGRAPGLLTGIAWPLSFYAGIKVVVAMATEARRVSVTTILLDEPLALGPEYRWAADLHILTGSVGQDQDGAAEAAPSTPHEQINPLPELIVAVLRRHGVTGAFGSRRLTGPQLLTSLFGDDLVNPVLLWEVIHTCEELVDKGKLSCEPGGDAPDTFVWWPSPIAQRQAQRQIERQQRAALQSSIRQHWVVPRLRALPAGYRASDEAQVAYAQYIRKLRGPGTSAQLPDGCTFVKGHARGSNPGPYWIQLT